MAAARARQSRIDVMGSYCLPEFKHTPISLEESHKLLPPGCDLPPYIPDNFELTPAASIVDSSMVANDREIQSKIRPGSKRRRVRLTLGSEAEP